MVKRVGIKKRYPKKYPLPVRPAIKSKPAPAAKKVISKMPAVSKAPLGTTTKLKPTSRSDVAIPAYGYIDVCFCVDATGSMSGEIAQVQSTIENIINNI